MGFHLLFLLTEHNMLEVMREFNTNKPEKEFTAITKKKKIIVLKE